MKNRITILMCLTCICVTVAQEVTIKPPSIFFELANSVGLELVYGNRFPYLDLINEEENYGSPIISGIIATKEKIIINKEKNIFTFKSYPYYLFICREKKKEYEDNDWYSEKIKYFNSYNYYLVFATSKKKRYQVEGVYKWGLTGMSKYLWGMRKEWDTFYKLLDKEDPREHTYSYRSKNSIKIKDFQNYSPIISSTSMSHHILIYHNNDWYVHTVQYE